MGIKACGGSHYWTRELGKRGHTVRLMAPQFVKPYIKSNKNDDTSAEAICEAVTRPNMRLVPAKTVDQQSALSPHRVRQNLVGARTAQAKMIRGLLMEYGIVIRQGIRAVHVRVPELLGDAENGLDQRMRSLLRGMHEHLKALDEKVELL